MTKVREIDAREIEKVVEELCVKANTVLREDVLAGIKGFYDKEEEGSLPKEMMGVLLENAKIAQDKVIPLCQDTGMAAIFVDLGKDVMITGDGLMEAIHSGVEKAYVENHFRKSVVDDPIMRNNTDTNTPAIIHVDIVDGDEVSISVMPKGFGSENKGRIVMLNPTSSPDEIVKFCVETVKIAGPDACPPYVLGIGLGGTMELCATLAKKALLRPINKSNPKEHIADLEREIYDGANALEIGIMGLGGVSTVMGVNIEEAHTHIAGLPVAVNVSCHALRSASAVI